MRNHAEVKKVRTRMNETIYEAAYKSSVKSNEWFTEKNGEYIRMFAAS